MFKNITQKKLSQPLTKGLFGALVVMVAWSGIGLSVIPAQAEASAGAVLRTCDVTASAPQIVAGGDITITWVTQGYEVVTLNGETVAPSGSKVFTNIQENSTYTLIAKTADGKSECVASVTVVCITPPPLPTCNLTPVSRTINSGETVTLTWTSSNGSGATLSGFGSVPLAGSRTTPPLLANTTYTLTITAETGTVTCNSVITVIIPPPPAPNCELTPASITIKEGETVTLNWSTENAKSATLTDFGTVSLAGSRTTPALFSNKTYTLNVVGNDDSTVSCLSIITVTKTPPPDPLPVCESFSANPSTINRGSFSTLSWVTKNATRVVIDNGIGEVAATGSLSVSPLATTTYTLTAYKSPGSSDKDTCTTTIVVKELPPVLPKCESFTATPNNLPFGGGTAILSWSTRNADTVTITPNIGAVGVVGSSSVALSTSTTYTLVAASGLNSDTCVVTITVAPPVVVPISCAANVTAGVSPTSIARGNNSTLSWSTTGVTAISWNQGITATGLSGSVTVAPTTNTTYILTATDGKDTITCPVTLTVTTGGGGGGGGSSSPTCELTVRDSRLSRGQETTLRWNSSRASDVVIVDSFGNTLVTTKDLMSSDKINLYSGSLRIAPTADTTYTMTVSRGSTERVCTAKVTIDNPFTVTQIRNQQPLVTSIALTDVPYTGFEAGPLLTFMFYLLLLVWALYVAYLIVIRRDMLAQYGLAAQDSHIVANNLTPEEIRPDVFVAKVQAPAAPPYKEVPKDLPIMGQIPVVGYASTVNTSPLPPQAIALPSAPVAAVSTDEVTVLENQAHAQKALLSSDAIRHFMSTVPTNVSREEALNQVIAEAKAQYPVEDGWIVINEERMRAVCLACIAPARSTVSPFMPTVIPEGSSSLAEAIITGNVVAAYEMIGHRPMFALADAAADLDAVYRLRRGEEVNVSALLEAETAALSDEKILAAIKALTGALDGVYTDEASAVKMAIMKAIKVLA